LSTPFDGEQQQSSYGWPEATFGSELKSPFFSGVFVHLYRSSGLFLPEQPATLRLPKSNSQALLIVPAEAPKYI
jgi:hypothetical protein